MIKEYSKMKDHSKCEYKITDIDTLRTFISNSESSVECTAIIHIKEERFCAFKVFPIDALFICFYHPQTKNSLNLKTIQRLTKFLKDFQRSNECSALVFIGSNDSFSSGFDLNEFDNKENKEDISKLYTDFIIETLEKGIEKGLYYMEDLLNIIKNNNKIEFKGNGYDYSED